MTKQLIYIASPLFNEMERNFNLTLATYLSSHFRIFLPQRDGELMVDLIVRGMPAAKARDRVFKADMAAIQDCVALVAVLDGRTVDEGVAFELGVAHCLSKICIGLQTDVRRLLEHGNNPMIDCSLTASCQTPEELLQALKRLCR
jgi:nucleoside 2-deoxyribosyltransferase